MNNTVYSTLMVLATNKMNKMFYGTLEKKSILIEKLMNMKTSHLLLLILKFLFHNECYLLFITRS